MRKVAFDFDGVINSYKSGWKGYTNIPDPPVEGIKEVLEKLDGMGYDITIFSSRAETLDGRMAIRAYLDKYDLLSYVSCITCEKPPAFVTVDDRCICFDGDTKSLVEKINNFRPYTEK